MRIFFVTNHYPPSNHGWGCMQLCEEVANGLCAKGHAVTVLTSTYGAGEETTHPYPVHRLLSLDPDWHSGKSAALQFFVGRRQRERWAVTRLHQLVTEFRPDVVFAWDTLGLAKLMLQEAEQLPGVAAAYYLAGYLPEVADEYITYWELPPIHWAAKLIKRPLAQLALHMLAREGKPIALRYENVMCVSDYVRRRLVSQGLISVDAVVVHNGLDFSHFSPNQRSSSRFSSGGLRCLVAGRLVPDKGIHTVIEALGLLKRSAALDGIVLTILGDGPPDYLEYLQERVSRHHLHDVVEFRSPVPREQMPQVLASYDTLILPSEYDEPLARAIQEAMAMSLLVIGTTTGGSGELLVHEKTGLVFEPGNPESLAAQFLRAINEPQFMATLAENGRQAVTKDFDIQRTIELVERYLVDLLDGGGAPG